ncbi:MAG: membrane associated rhomboid family serine protease [Methanobacteriota archaeon]
MRSSVRVVGYMEAETQETDVIQEISYVALSVVLILLAVTAYVSRPSVLHTTARRARERFVAGLPLGTFVIVSVNVVFFVFAQRAYTGDVLTVPYLSWSYVYPTGFLTGPVGHAGVPHIVGNLTATVVFAPVVEYVVGHKIDLSGERALHPLVRALVGVPLAWYGVGVFVSFFSWGPSIGFSGVVYFFFGFAVVFYPVVSVGLLVVTDAFRTLLGALRRPVTASTAGESYITPSWANIALDGHVLGLLVGVGVAVLVARRRGANLDAYRVGTAVFVLGLAQGLYAVWTVDGSTYVLYRAFGVAFVALLAVLVAYFVEIESSSPPFTQLDSFAPRRTVSVSTLLVPIVVICVIGLVTGLGTVSTVDDVDTVEVDGYSVWYGEDVENERVVSVPFIDAAPVNFTVSGVIVTNEDRGIWYRAASKGRLRTDPSRSFLVGGLGWYDEVTVERVGLESSTGNTSYSVLVTTRNETRAVYDSPPAPTATTVDGWGVNLTVDGGERAVRMRRGDRTRTVPLRNTSFTVEGVTFTTRDGRILAGVGDETRAAVGRITGARQDLG